MGLLSSLGSLSQTWEKLLRGESGIDIHQPFPEFSPLPLGLIGAKPIDLSHLTEIVVRAAIEDAGLTTPIPDCGVVIGSSRACQGSWEKLLTPGRGGGVDWLETLPNRGALVAAHLLETTAPVLAPMAACATGIWAIARAKTLIEQGYCSRCVVGGVEAPITPLTIAGFERLGALAKTGCYPFDKGREGLVLGEGGAVLVLESAELAVARGARIYGQLLGFGLTCDGYHVTTPEPTGKMAMGAIKSALHGSHLEFCDVCFIHTHGTGTKLGDNREDYIIKELFPFGVPVSSTKGATGHTLGASGAMGAVFSLLALQHQVLPPCVGLHKPEFKLNLVNKVVKCNIRTVLSWCFGFGGQNAVMALGNR